MRIVELTVTKKGDFGERAKKAEPWEFGIAFLSSDRVYKCGLRNVGCYEERWVRNVYTIPVIELSKYQNTSVYKVQWPLLSNTNGTNNLHNTTNPHQYGYDKR